MSDPLIATRVELDDLPTCTRRDCTHGAGDHFELGPSCHPRAELRVIYFRSRGRIALKCSICKTLVLEVQVAGALPS